jgi:putative transposase
MELVNRKITYRMYPNSEQVILLQDTLGLHCRVYNTFLEITSGAFPLLGD